MAKWVPQIYVKRCLICSHRSITYFLFCFQELVDSAKSKVSELAKQYENDESSGINIEIAKQILREEDRFDKKRFQAKIKEKHREEKRKLKASKKVARSDEEDEDEEKDRGVQLADYVSESEAEEPDLSWLPDPDKIYGPKKDSEDERSAEDSAEEEAEDSEEEEAEDNQIHRWTIDYDWPMIDIFRYHYILFV